MPSNFLSFDMAFAISLLTHFDLAELCDNNAKQWEVILSAAGITQA